MPQVYIHYFGNESSKSLLESKGIIRSEDIEKKSDILKPRQCANCNESNKHDAKFCNLCKMVLTYDSYTEVRNKDKQKIDRLELDMKSVKEGMNKIFLLIQQNSKLVNIKPEVLEKIINT
jgi:hypothetical protein